MGMPVALPDLCAANNRTCGASDIDKTRSFGQSAAVKAPILASTVMLLLAAPAAAQDMPGHAHHEPMQDAATDHSQHATMAMPAALGPFVINREASGTSRQPDASLHTGLHAIAGDWTLMGHALLNLAYTDQSGGRGDDKAFVAGMVMGMATGRLGPRDTVQLRAMLSPDPFMGKRGYPLLLAAGETADGATPLVDRQHPHELFMELSASYSRRLRENCSVFIYFGLPGEPAFGPPAFMHRTSIMDSPEAPITHHWLDSTHIAFGVVTAGVTYDGLKIEASRFKGRELDQNRNDIETPRFDSTAVRLSWNPSAEWALQASWARQTSPEQLEPDEDQEKWSASAIWTRGVGNEGQIAATAAWGRKISIEPDGHREPALDAWMLEATLKPDGRWTVFARGEIIETDELLAPPGETHGDIYAVGKASIGAIYDLALARGVKLGIGGLVARSVTPGALDPSYGGDRTSGTVFARLKLG